MTSAVNAATGRFLRDVARLQQRIERASSSISSGVRVRQPSDDPAALPGIQNLRAQLQAAAQLKTGLHRFKTETDLAEQQVSAAIQLLDRALTLASAGASSTATAASRAAGAIEVDALMSRLVGIANSAASGRFIFSGDNDQTPSYQLDPTASKGVTVYAGAASTRQAEDSEGIRFALAHSAEQIFDDPQSSVFAAVTALRTALSQNDEASVGTVLGALREASSHLNQELSFYGGVQNRLAGSIDAVEKGTVRLQTTLAVLTETDLVEATLDMTQAQTALQAAFAARAKVPRSSLFDYLG